MPSRPSIHCPYPASAVWTMASNFDNGLPSSSTTRSAKIRDFGQIWRAIRFRDNLDFGHIALFRHCKR